MAQHRVSPPMHPLGLLREGNRQVCALIEPEPDFLRPTARSGGFAFPLALIYESATVSASKLPAPEIQHCNTSATASTGTQEPIAIPAIVAWRLIQWNQAIEDSSGTAAVLTRQEHMGCDLMGGIGSNFNHDIHRSGVIPSPPPSERFPRLQQSGAVPAPNINRAEVLNGISVCRNH